VLILCQAVLLETKPKRHDGVVIVLGLLGVVFISCISIFDFFVHDDRPLALVLALTITGITFIAHAIYIKLGGKPKLYLLIFLMIVLHSFWIFSGVGARAGILWSLVMLPTFFYFLGHKNGAIVTGFLFVVTAFLLTFPPSMLPLAEFTEQLSQRYLMAYLVLSFSCFSIEVIHFDMREG
jgi:hypothetical protein